MEDIQTITLEEVYLQRGIRRGRKSKIEIVEKLFKPYLIKKGKEILDSICLSIGDFQELAQTSNPYPYIAYLKNKYNLIRMKYAGQVYYCIKKEEKEKKRENP